MPCPWARQSHDTAGELKRAGAGAYNNANRASGNRSEWDRTPSYQEALPSCTYGRKITRPGTLFDL
jgi:hypothetical protein